MNGIQFVIVFVLTLLVMVTTWSAFTSNPVHRRIVKRALSLMKRRSADAKEQETPTLRLTASVTRLDLLAGRLLPNPDHLRRLLERSGLGWSLGTYGAIAAMIGLGTVAAGLLLHFASLLCWIAGGVAAYWAPRLFVHWAIKRRHKAFLALLPDAIGLMVRGVRSGLPVTETVINVGREVEGPVGQEFRKVAEQIQLGQALEEVMWLAAFRLDLPEFTFMCIAFSIQRETGGNLAETLDNLEQLLRRRKQMALKVKAYASEAKTTSTIIGSMPFLMLGLLSVVNWNYVQVLFTTHSGNMLLLAAGGSLLFGIGVLKKLTSFEI